MFCTVEKEGDLLFHVYKEGLNTFVCKCLCFLLSTLALWCSLLGVHSCKGP